MKEKKRFEIIMVGANYFGIYDNVQKYCIAYAYSTRQASIYLDLFTKNPELATNR